MPLEFSLDEAYVTEKAHRLENYMALPKECKQFYLQKYLTSACKPNTH